MTDGDGRVRSRELFFTCLPRWSNMGASGHKAIWHLRIHLPGEHLEKVASAQISGQTEAAVLWVNCPPHLVPSGSLDSDINR